MTSPDKIRRAITYAANARKNIADVASINHYLSAGEHISQADLDAHHAGAREIPPLHVSPAPVEVDDFGAPVEQVEQVVTTRDGGSTEPEANAGAAGEAEAAAPLTLGDAKRHVVESQIRLRSRSRSAGQMQTAFGPRHRQVAGSYWQRRHRR